MLDNVKEKDSKQKDGRLFIKKYFQRCPECGKRLQYWKPISKKDIESWYWVFG